MNLVAASSLSRLRAALQPSSTTIKEFVLEKTRINGRPFSIKDHEYQGDILEEYSKPDIDLVIQKPSQIGVSEIIYRAQLAWSELIAGFSSAIVFPTKTMSNEVMATRIAQIIAESATLKASISPAVDSASVKMLRNGSIIYSLGASPSSKTTVINRPLRSIVVDEVARCDIDTISAMQSRQKHQLHKSSALFSTPLFEEGDIDLEMAKCGVIWEYMLRCRFCNHEFFPDFYQHIRLPGFNEPIKILTGSIVESKGLDIGSAELICPKCDRAIPHEYSDMIKVNTSEHPTRDKVGFRLSAFMMPKYIGPRDLIHSFLSYTDRNEFTQQVLGLPATKANSAMDTSQFIFENHAPGPINVMGVDIGKYSNAFVGTIHEGRLHLHSLFKIPLATLRQDLETIALKYRCVSTVIDYMPYTDVAVALMNTIPNCWVAMQIDPVQAMPELFRLRVKEDEAIGTIKFLQINKNLAFDTYTAALNCGEIGFNNFAEKEEIKSHHEALRRMKDHRFVELRHRWVKPQGSKTDDHWCFAGLFTFMASRLVSKAATSSLTLPYLVSSFRMRGQL